MTTTIETTTTSSSDAVAEAAATVLPTTCHPLNFRLAKAVMVSPSRFEIGSGNPVWGIAPIEWLSMPGVGKTAMARVLGWLLGFDYVKYLGGTQVADQGDVAGIPFPVHEDGMHFFRRLAPEFAVRARQARHALVIIDEIGDVAPPIQAALQTLINERVSGDQYLGGGVRFALLGNPTDVSTNGFERGMAVANRTGHYESPYSREDKDRFRTWVRDDAGTRTNLPRLDLAAEEARVLAAWPDAYSKARAIVSTFLSHESGGQAFLAPDPSDPKAQGAWQSHRTTTFAMQSIAAGYVHGLTETEVDWLIETYIGADAAAPLLEHLHRMELPDAAAILDGQLEWEHDPTRPDVTIAVAETVARKVVDTAADDAKLAHTRAVAAYELLARVGQYDLFYDAMRTLVRGGFGFGVSGTALNVLSSMQVNENKIEELLKGWAA